MTGKKPNIKKGIYTTDGPSFIRTRRGIEVSTPKAAVGGGHADAAGIDAVTSNQIDLQLGNILTDRILEEVSQ